MPETPKSTLNFAELGEILQSRIIRALLGEIRGGLSAAADTLYTMSCGRNYGMYQKAQVESFLNEEVARLAKTTQELQAEIRALRDKRS